MTGEVQQNSFGYFGKLPTLGDFVHHLLPQDFANQWHQWLQGCMVESKDALGEEFLTWYLNCPAWKFLAMESVCGAQAVVGLTIPSVDKVGRYFNFTIATLLPPGTNPCAYAMRNRSGLRELERLALDILEQDFSRDEIDLKLQEVSLQFKPFASSVNEIGHRDRHIIIRQDEPLPFSSQSSELLAHLAHREMGPFSMWWSGEEGQTRSKLLTCSGLPSPDLFLELLTEGAPPTPGEKELNYIDQLLASEEET